MIRAPERALGGERHHREVACFLPAIGPLWFGQRVIKEGILVVLLLQLQLQMLLLPLEALLLSVL